MPFFIVELKTTAVVQADNETDAFRKAMNDQRDICGDTDMEIEVGKEITSVDALPGLWDGDCIPYGGDRNARLKDLLHNEQDKARP